jgi:hypothetical protein
MPAPGERARAAAVALLVAAVAFLPFLRGTLAGACLYFRDLSLHFFPLRLFALEGLRQGELRLWNPYVHEGVPLTLPALGYPPDALGVLAPSPAVLSLLLALHVPLGALFFLLLARGLGLSREAAAGGALAYALSGFSLSSVNLYVYAQAAAWAPLVVLGLVRVLAGGGRRAVALAALAVAVALSTTGVEIVAQAVLAGVLLGWRAPRPAAATARLFAALGLATALAAPVLVLVGGQLGGSARGRGFPAEVVLAHSVHPFALVQSVAAGLFGNPANLANEWWGENFFPRGFPYVLSLYLGTALLALAATGAASRRPPAVRLLVLAALGVAVALGRWGVIGPLVEAVPALRLFRFPVKAWFTVHLAVALLGALGVQQLVEGRGRRMLGAIAAVLGGLLLASPLLPLVFPGPLRSFAAAFLPPGFAPEARGAVLGFVLRDAATGGALALAVALVALLALRGRLAGARPAWFAVTLVAVDLLRTGAGLNPMVSPAFYEPSPALAERLPALRAGRVYTCPIETSAAYTAGRLARGRDHELWSFGLLAETLSPSFNVPQRVPTALSPDLTMLVPTERTLPPDEGGCASLPRLLPRLRQAGVTTVLSLDPLADPDLAPLFVLRGPRSEPVAVHAYALDDPLPRVELVGTGRVETVIARAERLELRVESESAATLAIRDALAPGWTATVDGQPTPFEPRARHRMLALPAGRSEVRMVYRPAGLGLSYVVAFAAAIALAALAFGRPRAGAAAALVLAAADVGAGEPAAPAPRTTSPFELVATGQGTRREAAVLTIHPFGDRVAGPRPPAIGRASLR